MTIRELRSMTRYFFVRMLPLAISGVALMSLSMAFMGLVIYEMSGDRDGLSPNQFLIWVSAAVAVAWCGWKVNRYLETHHPERYIEDAEEEQS